MKRFAKLFLATLGFVALGFAMSLVPQKSANGTVATAVQVVNTPLSVTGSVSAALTGTPTVNVASMPPITVNGGSFNLNNSSSNPLFTEAANDGLRVPFVAMLCNSSGNFPACGFPAGVTLPASVTTLSGIPIANPELVLEFVSGNCSAATGTFVTSVRIGYQTPNSLPTFDYIPLQSVSPPSGLLLDLFAVPFHIEIPPGANVAAVGEFAPNGPNSDNYTCNTTLHGHFAPSP